MPNACNLCHSDQSPEWAAQALSLEVGEVAVVPTLAPVASPTPVPTATPFLNLEEEEADEEQGINADLPLLFVGGLGFMALLVALILVVQRRDRGDGRKA